MHSTWLVDTRGPRKFEISRLSRRDNKTFFVGVLVGCSPWCTFVLWSLTRSESRRISYTTVPCYLYILDVRSVKRALVSKLSTGAGRGRLWLWMLREASAKGGEESRDGEWVPLFLFEIFGGENVPFSPVGPLLNLAPLQTVMSCIERRAIIHSCLLSLHRPIVFFARPVFCGRCQVDRKRA